MKNNIYFFILIFLCSCKTEPEPVYKFTPGVFPDYPVNLGSINSEYDDYNSAYPSVLGSSSPLCFSSKTNSSGHDFNFVYKLFEILFDQETSQLTVGESTSYNLGVYIENQNLLDAIKKINTESDELGPYLIPQGIKKNGTNINKRYESYIFLYSNNKSGNQDIKFVHNLNTETYTTPKPIEYLNSDFDDAYPCLNWNHSSIYFCSNRNGSFDIYHVRLNDSIGLLNNIQDTIAKEIELETALSSPSDDKCPFIFDNIMVFTSNRPGGYGGYDLYYSILKDSVWSAPVNFGNKINTEYDEYRPIAKDIYGFTNYFMLFSSNRPGGKGGFDLYYVGIEKIR